MRNKTLSVVIPTVGRSVLDDTIASVLSQRVMPYETVIWDNSGNAKAQKQSKYSNHPRLKWYAAAKQLSIVESWNTAVSLTSGEYIYILGDDDLMLPGFVETVCGALDSGAELLHVKCLKIDRNASLMELPGDVYPADAVYSAERFVSGVINDELRIFLSALVFPRAVFDRIGGFRDIVMNGLAMDVLFDIEAAVFCGSVTVISEPVWLYRSMVSDWSGSVKRKRDILRMGENYQNYRNHTRKMFKDKFPGLWDVFHRKLLIQQMISLCYRTSLAVTFLLALQTKWSLKERYYILRDCFYLLRHRT